MFTSYLPASPFSLRGEAAKDKKPADSHTTSEAKAEEIAIEVIKDFGKPLKRSMQLPHWKKNVPIYCLF